uniref:Uncharacterized protein n=1 Tax=Rhizophora mucronata TaxID=61149 RepID=A0A2P2JQ64_RHIMU
MSCVLIEVWYRMDSPLRLFKILVRVLGRYLCPSL